MNIAIVEDEPKLAILLQEYLQRDGFTTIVHSDGNDALRQILADPPDLVLLDLMLPGLDGMSICRELRKVSNLPIIMMTARVEEIDRLLGLELGADDYICKPFSPREVVARVKAVLRRVITPTSGELAGSSQPDQRGDVPPGVGLHTPWEADQFRLESSTASVHIKGKHTSLTAVELRLLSVLCERPGQIFNREQLMRRMYDDNRIVSDRTIDSHVKKLRQKLERLDTTTTYIHSVYGIGYKFEIMLDQTDDSHSA